MLAEEIAEQYRDREVIDREQSKALSKLDADLKSTMHQQISRLKDHLNSEEERSYFLLAGDSGALKEAVTSQFLYQPSFTASNKLSLTM